jgi:hypothetical protein
MGIPITIPTGKNNMLASLRAYLQANLPLLIGNPTVPYTIEFEQYENADTYPSISFEDLGIPSLGGHAFDDFLGEGLDDNGNAVTYYGKIAQTIVEFNCQAQMNESTSALQQCYQMRDQLEQLFMFSGRNDHTGAQVLPAIGLMYYDTNPASTTGSVIWAPMERDSIWMESFVGTDPARPGIKRLSIRVRIYWHLQEN